MAYHLQAQGDRKAAKTLYRDLLARTEDSQPLVWNNLGALFAEEHRWQEALNCYQSALEGDPHYAEALYNQGVAYWHLKQWEKVRQSFRACLKENPEHDQARYFLEKIMRSHAESTRHD